MLCSQLSSTLGLRRALVPARFVPEGKLDSVPQSEFVVDGSKIVLDDMLRGSDGICDFPILESLRNEFDDAMLSLAGRSIPIPLASIHNCLRYKRVASFTRLIPLLMPNRRKSRLKCAFTVRRAMLS